MPANNKIYKATLIILLFIFSTVLIAFWGGCSPEDNGTTNDSDTTNNGTTSDNDSISVREGVYSLTDESLQKLVEFMGGEAKFIRQNMTIIISNGIFSFYSAIFSFRQINKTLELVNLSNSGDNMFITRVDVFNEILNTKVILNEITFELDFAFCKEWEYANLDAIGGLALENNYLTFYSNLCLDEINTTFFIDYFIVARNTLGDRLYPLSKTFRYAWGSDDVSSLRQQVSIEHFNTLPFLKGSGTYDIFVIARLNYLYGETTKRVFTSFGVPLQIEVYVIKNSNALNVNRYDDLLSWSGGGTAQALVDSRWYTIGTGGLIGFCLINTALVHPYFCTARISVGEFTMGATKNSLVTTINYAIINRDLNGLEV